MELIAIAGLVVNGRAVRPLAVLKRVDPTSDEAERHSAVVEVTHVGEVRTVTLALILILNQVCCQRLRSPSAEASLEAKCNVKI